MEGYKKTIKLINNIFDRYESMMPGVFKELNKLEKSILAERPKHLFSKADALQIMEKYSTTKILSIPRKDTISECLVLLYNWYKTKIIYSVEQEAGENSFISIQMEKISRLPYSGIYLDLNFYKLGYYGCFISMVKEPKGSALQKFLLLGFVKYHSKTGLYGIEPFMLELKDGILVEDAFDAWATEILMSHMQICKDVDSAIAACEWAVNNLYAIIDRLDSPKELRQPSTTVKRNITSQTLTGKKNTSDFRLSKEAKYKYAKTGNGNGSQKAPHVRRAHHRHLPIKDELGNVIGEKVITIREMKIHAEKENIVTVKLIN